MPNEYVPNPGPGINIRTDHSPTHNYAIQPMQTDCWPVRLLPDWDYVVIAAVQNSFWSQQQASLRAWLSITPNGMNVMPMERRDRDVRLQGLGNTWCFHRFGLEPKVDSQIIWPIDPLAIGDAAVPGYWMNFQNLSGNPNSYYFQSTYHKSDATLVV